MAQDGLEGALSFSDQKAPEKLKKGFSTHPYSSTAPTPPHLWVGPLRASPPLEGSSETGSDMVSEPVTVSCGFLLTLLGRGSCNCVGRMKGWRQAWGDEGCCRQGSDGELMVL